MTAASFAGCNVENSAYPAGICAERSALAAAVAGGVRRFDLLVVVTEADEPTPPCGMCRQALVEFAPDLAIVSYTKHGGEAQWNLATLASASLHAGRAESSPMKLGRIVGTVVSTRKDPSLDSLKLLIVENLTTDLGREGGYVVAVDSVGAGLGEVILYATGSSARLTAATKDRPVDAVIMGIVDSFDVEGRSVRLA